MAELQASVDALGYASDRTDSASRRNSTDFSRLARRDREHHLAPRQIDQHLLRFIARSVDQLVIRLVEIGEQAAIAPADTGLPIVTGEQVGIARCDRFIDLLKVHKDQRLSGDFAEGLRILDQTVQHPGACSTESRFP